METEKAYNHEEESVGQACGLDQERMDDLTSLAFQFAEEGDTVSEVAEKIETSFSKREMAYFSALYITNAYRKSKILARLSHGMGSEMGSPFDE